MNMYLQIKATEDLITKVHSKEKDEKDSSKFWEIDEKKNSDKAGHRTSKVEQRLNCNRLKEILGNYLNVIR